MTRSIGSLPTAQTLVADLAPHGAAAPAGAARRPAASDARERLWAGLMQAAQDGDAAAYAALLRACLPFVRSVARGQGVAPSDLDDVVQEVLLTLHRVRATYDPARPFTAWLRAITQRRAIDELRRSWRGAREVHAPIDYEQHPDPTPDPLARAQNAAQARLLGQHVAQLPAAQREAVQLLGLSEHSLEEAAARTGRNKVALKVNLHRALKSLRTRLHDAPVFA